MNLSEQEQAERYRFLKTLRVGDAAFLFSLADDDFDKLVEKWMKEDEHPSVA